MASRLPLICVLLVGIGVSVSTFGTERVHHVKKKMLNEDDYGTVELDQGGESSGNDVGGQKGGPIGFGSDIGFFSFGGEENGTTGGVQGFYVFTDEDDGTTEVLGEDDYGQGQLVLSSGVGYKGGSFAVRMYPPSFEYLKVFGDLRKVLDSRPTYSSAQGFDAVGGEDDATTGGLGEDGNVHGRLVLGPGGGHKGGSFAVHMYPPSFEYLQGLGDLGKVLDSEPTNGNGFEGQVADTHTMIRSKRIDFEPLVENGQGSDFEGHDGINAIPAGQGKSENQDGSSEGGNAC